MAGQRGAKCRGLELDLDRFADGFERFEVELDIDGDFLVELILGYSP